MPWITPQKCGCCEDCVDVVDVSCSIDWDAGPTLYWNAAYATSGSIVNDGSTIDISSSLTGGASDSGSETTPAINFDEDVEIQVTGPCGTASTICRACDDITCSLSLSSTYNPDKVKLTWTVQSSASGYYPIDSIVINGVQQLATGEQVFSKTGEIEWNRGSSVPISISMTAENVCGNTCTTSVTPSCCMRNLLSYLEITGFNASYSHTCTFPNGSNNTSSVTGLDGLNGIWSDDAADSDVGTGCWRWPLPIEATGVELYTEVDIPGNPPFVPSEYRWTRLTGKAYLSSGSYYLQFLASTVSYYWEYNGNVIGQGTAASSYLRTLTGSWIYNLPTIQCDTPGAYGSSIGVFPQPAITNQCDEIGQHYNPPPTCTGEDAITGSSCYHFGGSIRGWLN